MHLNAPRTHPALERKNYGLDDDAAPKRIPRIKAGNQPDEGEKRRPGKDIAEKLLWKCVLFRKEMSKVLT